MEKTQVFDESYVDCNQCQHYWNAVCDGAPTQQIKPCTSFKATRQTDVPLQIEKLSKGQKQSEKGILWLHIIVCLHLLAEFLEMIGVL